MNIFEKLSAAEISGLTTQDLITLYKQMKAESQWNSNAAITANMTEFIRQMRFRIQSGVMMYYVMLPNGFPYQESSKYGLSAMDTTNITLRLFTNEEDAALFAEAVNKRTNMAGAKAGREEHDIVSVGLFGLSDGMDTCLMMKRMGIDTVLFGSSKDGEPEFSLQASTLEREDDGSINFFAVAPKVYAMICMIDQAVDECQPNSEIQKLRMAVCQYAAAGNMAVAISQADFDSGECHPFTLNVNGEEYVELFTDWAAMLDCLQPDTNEEKNIYMAFGNWSQILAFDKPLVINRNVSLTKDSAFLMGIYEKKCGYALEYIASCYDAKPESVEDVDRCISILNDIRRAGPVCDEFFTVLAPFLSDNEDQRRKVFPDITAANENAVSVGGITAKRMLDTGLCATPAAAYHVLSLLYNDPNGEHMRAFQNAELYD